jgi:fibrillarin-like pre-rRNA processing protein
MMEGSMKVLEIDPESGRHCCHHHDAHPRVPRQREGFPASFSPWTPCQFVLGLTEYRGVYTDGDSLYTENLVPGASVYGERLLEEGGREFRAWNPRRSKLAALLLKGFPEYPFKETSKVLYLGAATGTTASHISDIVPRGLVYCVEISSKAFQKLLVLSEQRRNLVPILADARNPEAYRSLVGEVDVLYQDVAQRDQAQIFMKNASLTGGSTIGILMVKSRSVDVAAPPERVFHDEMRALRAGGIKVLSVVRLEPYQGDHAAFILERRAPAARSRSSKST